MVEGLHQQPVIRLIKVRPLLVPDPFRVNIKFKILIIDWLLVRDKDNAIKLKLPNII